MDNLYRIAASAFGVLVGTPSAYAVAATEALWHFDETSGIVAVDATGHGHNGSLQNVAIGRTGYSGHSYYFNGINSKVVIPNVTSLKPGSRNVSISSTLAVWGQVRRPPQGRARP